MTNRRTFVGVVATGRASSRCIGNSAATPRASWPEPNPPTWPIEQATRFELVINMKTAKALGIAIPQLLWLRAGEVIE